MYTGIEWKGCWWSTVVLEGWNGAVLLGGKNQKSFNTNKISYIPANMTNFFTSIVPELLIITFVV